MRIGDRRCRNLRPLAAHSRHAPPDIETAALVRRGGLSATAVAGHGRATAGRVAPRRSCQDLMPGWWAPRADLADLLGPGSLGGTRCARTPAASRRCRRALQNAGFHARVADDGHADRGDGGHLALRLLAPGHRDPRQRRGRHRRHASRDEAAPAGTRHGRAGRQRSPRSTWRCAARSTGPAPGRHGAAARRRTA